MGFLSNLFGGGKKNEAIAEALQNGAILLDVRSPAEFSGGSIKGAKNYPVQEIDKHISSLKKTGKPVVAFCASGMRSAAAAIKLKSNGIEAFNAGSMGAASKLVQQ